MGQKDKNTRTQRDKKTKLKVAMSQVIRRKWQKNDIRDVGSTADFAVFL